MTEDMLEKELGAASSINVHCGWHSYDELGQLIREHEGAVMPLACCRQCWNEIQSDHFPFVLGDW